MAQFEDIKFKVTVSKETIHKTFTQTELLIALFLGLVIGFCIGFLPHWLVYNWMN